MDWKPWEHSKLSFAIKEVYIKRTNYEYSKIVYNKERQVGRKHEQLIFLNEALKL